MTQSRTHTCNELRLADAGKTVTLVGWYENLRRVSKNLGFLILRDFYGTTQIVIETEEMMEQISRCKHRVHPLRYRCCPGAFQQEPESSDR